MISRILPFVLTVLFCLTYPCEAADQRLRLVSLAPSLTEMVFGLGAGDSLAGVTDHCRYPPEVKAIAKVGSYQTPSVEAICSLRPGMVLALKEHAALVPRLEELGISVTVFDHRTLAGLLDSLEQLGRICSAEESARENRIRLEEAFRPTETDRPRPKLLFLISRDYGRGNIANAYALGRDGLYDLLITAIGCRNAYEGKLPYPLLSGEGIAVLNPDIIVEAIHGGAAQPPIELRRDWESLANLSAVRNNGILHLESDEVFVPGMRLVQLRNTLEKLVRDAMTSRRERP